MMPFNRKQIFSYFKSSEGRLYILIGCVWGYSLLGLANALFLRIPGLADMGPYARDIVIVIAILFSLKAIFSHLQKSDFVFLFLFFVFYLFQFLIHPENSQGLSDNFFTVFMVAFPMYFLGCTYDISKLYNFLLVISISTILYFAFFSFVYSRMVGSVMETGGYLMGPAYDLLPSLLFVLWHFMRKRGFIYLILFLLGLMTLLSYGVRGPIVCVGAFIVTYLLFSERKRWWLILLTIAVSVLVYYYFEWMVMFLDGFFSLTGRSTRLTEKVFTETLDDDSGRGSIIRILKRQLNDGDKISYGIFGSYKYVGGYAHRIQWDFWFSFGYIFGSFIMLALAIVFIKGMKKCDTSEERGFWILLMCNSIVALMFSGSYIISGPFFLFLGYCISRLRNNQLKIIK